MSLIDNESAELSLTQEKFIQELLRYVRAKAFFSPGDRVLLACSGGLDSTVLVHALSRVARMLAVELIVVHVDHATRAEMSQQEGRWVGVLAQRLNLACYALTLRPGERRGQAQLRDQRREALIELARDLGASTIATAHQADDNAETFLMRAMSGAGTKGLAGISPRAGKWVRPLLWATRAELEDYARQQALGWVEDPSNLRGLYLRNRLRQEALPLLEEIRPAALRNLHKVAERIEEEEAEWEAWIEKQLEDPRECLALAWLEKWPRALQRRIVRVWLQRLSIEAEPQLVEALLRSEEIVHAKGTFLRRADNWVFNPAEEFALSWEDSRAVELGQKISLGSSLAWSFIPGAPAQLRNYQLSLYLVFRDPQRSSAGRLQLAWNKLPAHLALRARHRADAKDLDAPLEKLNIPKPYWKAWPLLVNRDLPHEVIALVGVKVLAPYALRDLERCVCLEAFFEENLSPSV